jgi:hypothetical protein
MSIITSFFRSLLLTVVFSFVAPMTAVGGLLATLSLIGYIPGLQQLTVTIMNSILQFLAIFGSGNSLHGLVVIASTCSFVGILFDTYVHYRYLILRLNS